MHDSMIGVVEHLDTGLKTDYLYRISIKGIIFDRDGQVLVVKESGRSGWDLPGGGMDHGETIKQAIAREMHEEVSLEGDFSYKIVAVEDPKLLKHSSILQIRLIFLVTPEKMDFKPGVDADEVRFIDLDVLRDSGNFAESKVYEYVQAASTH